MTAVAYSVYVLVFSCEQLHSNHWFSTTVRVGRGNMPKKPRINHETAYLLQGFVQGEIIQS